MRPHSPHSHEGHRGTSLTQGGGTSGGTQGNADGNSVNKVGSLCLLNLCERTWGRSKSQARWTFQDGF